MSTPQAPSNIPPSGNLPATEHLGIVFLEYVNIERKSGGVWNLIAANVKATFEPLRIHTRVEMETWTHKPLLCLWLLPNTSIQDGDRVIRSDNSHWYIRGAPLMSPAKTHIVAIAEYATEDKLFATRDPNEPS